MNWSAACGRQSCGIPCASAPRNVPDPACDTTTAQCGKTLDWGTYRFDPNASRLWAERGRVARRPHGHQDADRPCREGIEGGPQRCAVPVDRPECQVDERVVTGDGGRCARVGARVVKGHRSKELPFRDMTHVPGLEAGRVDVEVEMVVQAPVRPRFQPDGPPERRGPVGRGGDPFGWGEGAEGMGHRRHADDRGRDGTAELRGVMDDEPRPPSPG